MRLLSPMMTSRSGMTTACRRTTFRVFIHGVPVCPGKGAHLGAFSYKGLDDADAGKAFLHKVRQIGNGLLALPEPGVHDFAIVNFPGADEQHGDDCPKSVRRILT